jgi:hypothetical protein
MRSPILRRQLTGAVVAVVVGFLAIQDASAVAWANATGANSAFGWSAGMNNVGLYGNPTVYDWGFSFEDTVNYRSEGGGGPGNIATDWARWTSNVATATPSPGPSVLFVRVIEWGYWGTGEVGEPMHPDLDPTDFSALSTFNVSRFVPSPGNSGTLQVPITFYPNGIWYAERTLSQPWVAATGMDRFQVRVDNSLQVLGTAPPNSFIEKAAMIVITPEPTTVLFLLAGFTPLALRRSRK